MAEVPTSLLDELTDEVNKLSGDAQEKTRAALKTLIADWEKHGGGDVAALRNAAYETIEAVLLYYADTCAAARAAEYYDAVRQAQGFSGGYSAVAESMRDPDATLGAVKYFVGKVAEGAPEVFVSLCVTRIDEEVRRAANRCVAHNARKDPAKPRYARVPRGETCGFCLMLASFGFNAKTEEAASHSHAHCDCRIVPGFDGKTKVRGYDPDGMYERYNECLAALGGRNGISSDWYAMPREDREAFIKGHGGSNSKALKAYTDSRISSEIGTRDPRWFKTGKEPKVGFVSKEVKKRATKAEIGTAKRLAHHGVASTFIQDYRWVQEDGRKRKVGLPDLENGIEIKTIGTSGNAWGAMKNYLDSTAGKEGVKCMVVDNSVSDRISDEALIDAANELAAKYPKVAHVRLLLKDGRYIAIK
ncbi:hypothetical protein [Parolsenella catena]|jgi:hypothetical protein|uniref:VG15 protein n=1 Tax=Parolsenella catena TaxID=2003188 RepID=UPI002FDE39EE